MKVFTAFFVAFLTVSSLFAQIPTNDLVAHYSFNDCSGFDNSGNGSNGSILGNPDCEPCGVTGQALDFRGIVDANGKAVDYMLALNQVNNIFGSNDFAVSFYMKSKNSMGVKDILSKRETCTADNAFAIKFQPATNSIIVELSENSSKNANVSATLDFGRCWQHVVFVRNGTRSLLYINGTLRSENTAVSRVNISNNAVLSITNSPCQLTTEVPFEGVLDEFLFYDKALNADQIRDQLYLGPDEIINEDATIFLGESIDLNATMSCADSYLWSPANFLTDATIPNPTSTPNSTITYTLSFTENLVCIAYDSVRITVIDPADLDCNDIFLPKAFTPNNDNLNDSYGISNPYAVENLISLEIFDRWGARMFFTDEPFERWDGSFQNQPVNPGVMLYKVRFMCDGEEKIDVGSLSVIR